MAESRVMFADIGPDGVVTHACPRWLATYFPGALPGFYIGRDHAQAFQLDRFPEYRAMYDRAREGGCSVWAGVIATAGRPKPFAAIWRLFSDHRGGVRIVSDDVALALVAIHEALEESPADAQVVWSTAMGGQWAVSRGGP